MEEISTVNQPDLHKNVLKTCIICFKTDNSKNQRDLFELWLADDEQITLLEKLQSFVHEKLWVNECTVLCENCIKELNEAFNFRRRILKSQELWKSSILPDVTSSFSSQKSQLNDNTREGPSEEDVNDILIPICNYDIEITAANLKAADLGKDQLSYYSYKNCDELFVNSTELPTCEYEKKCSIDANVDVSSAKNSGENLDGLTENTPKKKKNRLSAFECDLCGKEFKDLNGRNRHKIKVHFQEKAFPCNFCNKSFKQKYHLKEHLTSHTGEKNYSCTICNKLFQRISSQRRHMRSHEKVPGKKVQKTPFLCTICGKSFPYSNGVQRHMRVHTGERKYKCHMCDRKFMQSTHLHVHVRTHTGEKPYTCNYCEESFSLKAALQKHIVNSHNTDKNVNKHKT